MCPDRTGPTQTESGQTAPDNEEQPIAHDQQSQISNISNLKYLKSQIPNTNDEELLEAAADLPLRLKGRSRFDQLTAEQQAAIITKLRKQTLAERKQRHAESK